MADRDKEVQQTTSQKEQNVSSPNENDIIPSDVSEVIEQLPPEEKQEVQRFMLSMQERSIGPMPHPFAGKITPEHITKIIENSERDEIRSFKDSQTSRWFTLAYVGIFVALLIFLTIYLSKMDKEIFKQGMVLIGTYLGGIGSGFGARSYMDRNKK